MSQEFLPTRQEEPIMTKTNTLEFTVHHRDGKSVTVHLPGFAAQDAPFIQLWLRNQRAYKTLKAYATNIQRFYKSVEKPLAEVNQGDLQGYAVGLYSLKPTSQAAMLASVKSFLTFCTVAGYLSANVGGVLKLPQPEQRQAERILSEVQVQKMLELETDQRNHALLLMLYGGALRVSEVCDLQRRHLQPHGDAGQVTISGKCGKTRCVPLKPSVWRVLMELCENFSPDMYVFQSRQSSNAKGQPTERRLDQSQVDEVVKAAAIRAGIHVYERVIQRGPKTGETEVRSSVSPRWLRLASASHAIERGARLPLVYDTLGQSSISVTNVDRQVRPNEGSTLYLPL